MLKKKEDLVKGIGKYKECVGIAEGFKPKSKGWSLERSGTALERAGTAFKRPGTAFERSGAASERPGTAYFATTPRKLGEKDIWLCEGGWLSGYWNRLKHGYFLSKGVLIKGKKKCPCFTEIIVISVDAATNDINIFSNELFWMF
ncbi:hypothetical protein AVEN_91761-1 [Araneus ventricosus]|uniref:Uncharacterized protein n=1 Tax=Araneus ventricosus TaxID=182803 RepID=A0A4Y2HVX0_ARAVE|nr:hypothetical protein AVEN_91761-1 [Araneus ventricosus]